LGVPQKREKNEDHKSIVINVAANFLNSGK
jgi:hypothetical protein